MNLEELQIKVSIELKDLEKQLKDITKSIDKTFGPKTTKKLMQDNHKVIKAESIAINRTLNKAFEVDYKKFNANLNTAMNQAKITVRSACNDIRRELNNALNVRANIRVTGNTSLTGSATGKSSGSTTASSMASSQYIGAMIIKATNTIIKVNNANATKLEQAINKLANKFGKDIKIGIDKVQVNVPKITVKPEIKGIEVKPEIKEVIVKPEVKVNIPDVKVNIPDVIVNVTEKEIKVSNDNSDIVSAITRLGNFNAQGFRGISKSIGQATSKIISAIKSNGSTNNDKIEIEYPESSYLRKAYPKQLGTGSYGNEIVKTSRPLGEAKEIFTGEVIDPKIVPIEVFEQLQNIIEVINYEIKDTEIILANVEDRALSIVKAFKGLSKGNTQSFTGEVVDDKSLSPLSLPNPKAEPIVIDEFKVIDDELKEQVDKAIDRIKQVDLEIPISTTLPRLNAPDNSNPQLPELSSLQLPTIYEDLSPEGIAKLPLSLEKARKIMKALVIITGELAKGLKKSTSNATQLSNTLKPQAPESLKNLDIQEYDLNPPRPETPQIVKDLEDQIQEIEIPISVKDTYPGDEAFAEELKKIEEDEIEINIDTTKAKEKLDKLTKEVKEKMADLVNVESDLSTPGSHVANKANKLIKGTGPLTSNLNLGNAESQLKKIQEQIKQISDEFDTIWGELSSLDVINLEELYGSIEGCVPILEEIFEKLNLIDDERLKINLDTTEAQQNIETLRASIDMLIDACMTDNIKGVRDLLDNNKQSTQKPKSNRPKPPKPIVSGGLDDYTLKVEALSSRLDIAADDLMEVTKQLDNLSSVFNDLDNVDADTLLNSFEDLDQCEEILRKLSQTDLSHLKRDIKSLAESFSGSNFDTSDIKKLQDRLTALLQIRSKLSKINKDAQKGKGIDTVGIDTQFRAIKDYKNVSFGEGTPDSLGFLPNQNIFSDLIAQAKKAASTVNKLISDALNPEVGPKALDEALTSFEGKVVSLAKKVKDAVVGMAKAIKTTLVKAFDVLKTTVITTGKIIGKVLGAIIIGPIIAVKKGIEACIKAFKSLASIVANVASKIKNWLMIAFAHTLDVIEDKLKKCVNAIKKLGTAIANIAKTIKDKLTNAFTTAIDFIVSKFNKLTEAIKGIATNIRNWFMIAFAHIADVVEDKINKILQVVKKVASSIANVAKAIKDTLVNAFTTAIDFIIDKFNKLTNAVKEVATKIKNWFMIAFAHIADVIEDKFNKVFEVIKKVASAISNVAKTIKDALVNAFTTAVDFIVDKFNKVASAINNAFTKVKNHLMITFAHIADVIEDKFNKVKDAVTKVFKHITTLAKAYGSVIGKHLGKMLSPIVNLAKKIIQPFKDAISKVISVVKSSVDKIKELFGKISSSIAQGFNKAVDSVKSAINKITSTVKNGFNKAIGSIKSTVDKISSSIKNGFNKAVDATKSAMNKISSSVKSGFSKAVGSVKSTMGKISSTIRSGFGKTKTTVDKISSSIKNSFSNIKTSKLYTNIAQTLNKAKSAVSKFSGKIKPILNKAFDSIKTGKLSSGISNALSKAKGAVSKFAGKVRPALNRAFDGIKASKIYNNIVPALNKAKSAVSKFASKVGPTLNKAFSKINVSKIASGIGKGLNGAKKALSKFASASKSIWGKIKSIFSKGASDATKTTGKLTGGLKNLLSQAFGFLSIAGLISTGKQLIEQSQMLAQSEVKLASLMKQRMGATNDTIAVIRKLAEEQAKLGVVSETAMKNGAQQLAMYVHSAKALETLMPAIANLTARRGGVFATPEDAEEVATQLGEAIREGTTTPLEQSGIYLSEAEIQKFAALRTEEERAAYLANVIAKNVGNINEALANTPHGAIAQLKNNFQSLLGTLGIFLANVLKPIVQWLNTIVVACNNALKGLGKLLGFDMTGGAESVPDVGTGGGGGGSTPVDTTTPEIDTGGIDDAKDSYDDAKKAADEATEANEKFKGSLMGFDEINILSDNTQKSYDPDKYNPDEYTPEEYDPTDITPGVGGQLPAVGDLKETDSIFSKFSDKMKAFIDEVLEPFKNAWALLGDRWKAEWADLIESFKHFCDSLGKFLVSVWEHGGKEFVQHMAEIALAVGIAAMEIGGEILDSLARLWDHLDPAKNMNTQGFLDALNEVSVKLRDFILGLGDHFESLMANGGQDVLNAMGDCFMNLGEAAVRGLGVAIDALDGLINHLDPANNTITRGMLKSWEDAFHAIGNCALELANLLESVLANGGQEVINALGDAFVSFAGLVGDIVKEVSDAFAGLFKHLDPATNEFTKDFLKAWENAFKEISTMFGKMGDFLGSVMDNGGQELLNSIGDLGMKIGEAVGVVVEEFAKTFGELLDHLDPSKNSRTKNMLKSLDGLVDSVTKFVDSCIKAFKKFMDSGGREFINNLGDILAVVVDLAATLAGGIIDLLTAFMDSWAGQALIEGVAKALEWVSEKILALEDVINRIKEIFQDVIDIIVGILEGDGEKVGRAFANLIKNAFKLSQDIMDWLIDIGVDLILGLIEGLKKTPEIIWNGIKFIFDTIVGFFKELFGIHSPSTVFADLGVNLIEGLIEGIKSMASAVWDAITELAESIFNAFKDIIDKLSEIWGNIKESASEAWNTIKDTIVEKCTETYDNVKEKYESIKETVSTKLGELKEDASDKWSKIKEDTSKFASEIKEEASDKYNELKDKLTDTMENWRKNSEDKWNKIKEKTDLFVKLLKENTEEMYGKLKDKLTETMDNWRQNSEDKWNKVKEKTADLVSKLKSETEDKYNKFKEALTTTMENWRKASEEKWTNIKNKTTELAENLKSTVEDKYNKFKEKLSTTLENLRKTSEDKWTDIKEKANAAVENLKTTTENKFNTLKTNLASKMSDIKSDMETKWNNAKDATSKTIETIRTNAEKTYSTLKTNIGNKINEIKSDAQTKWEEVKTTTVSKVSEVVSNATTKYGEMKTNFTKKMDEVKSALGPKWEELKTSAKTGASKMLDGISSGIANISKTITKPFEDAKSAVEDVIRRIGNTFKNANWSFPKIKLPHLSVSGEFSLNPPKVPKFSVEWYKRGGIIDGITPLGFTGSTLHMGGEAGSELVMPLENTSFTSKIAMALGQAVDNALAKQSNPYNNNNNTMNDNRDIVLKVNEREFARASINSINKLQRESNRTLLDI